MSNVYLSAHESMDLLDSLSNTEHKLYVLLKNSVLQNPTPDYFSTENLSNKIQVTKSTLDNAKSALKKKGYALVVKFKDEDGDPMVRVVVGKDQMQLYNLGVKVEITNAKAFKKLLDQFPVTDPALSKGVRENMVEQLNSYYLEHSSEFK